MPSGNRYPVLKERVLLRKLEQPLLYEPEGDELYTLDTEALSFLQSLGEREYGSLNSEQQALVEYLETEGLIEYHPTPTCKEYQLQQSPLPSLRFLQLNITTKCNLNCLHCNLGKTPKTDMSTQTFLKAVREFAEMGGLKLIISGGEPLLHPKFFAYLEDLQKSSFRKVVLTNATLLNKKGAERLSKLADEVQVSLDGREHSHNRLRGRNDAYQKTMQGIKHLQQAGIDLSIATMIHPANLGEFEELNQVITDINPIRWSIDVPCIAGNLRDHPELLVPLEDAADIMRAHGFGGALHPGSEKHTCGSHLCEIMPEGNVVRCSFFEESMGNVNTQSLEDCWHKVCTHYLWRTDELACAGCSVMDECRGGCRYRAFTSGDILGPDPLQCSIHRITPPLVRRYSHPPHP